MHHLFQIWYLFFSALPFQFAGIQQQSRGQPPTALKKLPVYAVQRFGEGRAESENGYFVLRYSPDGKYLAARNRTNQVEIRDARTGKKLGELKGKDGRINGIAFSADSGHVLTCSGFGGSGIDVWDVPSGRLTVEIACQAISARFTNDGASISVLEQETISRYSWPSGQLIERAGLPRSSDRRLAVSDDWRFLVSCHPVENATGAVTRLIDLTGESSVILDGRPELPNSVVFSSDNRWVAATYSGKNEVRLWNLKTPGDLYHELKGHSKSVQSIAFSPDNRFLVSGGRDHSVIVWDLLTREKIGSLKGHSGSVNACEFSPAGWFLATGASGPEDGSVIVWSFYDFLFGRPMTPVSAVGFEDAWNRLGSSNPLYALTTVNQLRRADDVMFQRLLDRVHDPSSASRQDISHWIEELDGPTWHAREIATMKLLAVQGQARRQLMATLESAPSTEVRCRIDYILEQHDSLGGVNLLEARRMQRSIFLLELSCRDPGRRELALPVLEAIADGSPNPDIFKDAREALDRIRKSSVK